MKGVFENIKGLFQKKNLAISKRYHFSYLMAKIKNSVGKGMENRTLPGMVRGWGQ